MVGVVSRVVIPVKKMGTKDQVFTIVCEVMDSAQPHHYHHHHHHQQEEEEPLPLNSRLWKMASAWRVISFFVVVFVLPTVLISLPLYARYHLYHARHLPMTETDTRALNHAVSSFWCQGQRVSSNGSLDAFLLAGEPKVKEERRHINLKRNLTLEHDDIEYWGVYLLKDSSFLVSSSARWPGGVLLVVQGEENLRKCFYRENRVQDELQNPPSVYKSPLDQESLDESTNQDGEQAVMDEEHHWEEEENNAGEVFDDYQDIFRQDDAEAESKVPQDLDEDLLTDDDALPQTHKYALDDKLKALKKSKKEEVAKKKQTKQEIQHGRSRRSLLDEQTTGHDPSNPSDDRTPATGPRTLDTYPQTEDDTLDMLRQFNETLVATAGGESSYSSSEEFMENCRNAILMVELNTYIFWENHISNADTENNPNSWKFFANSSDYFYFIFTSDNNIEKNEIGFELDLYRAIYDISEPLESCRNATECVFPLAFTQTEAVVVEVPAEENLKELHSFEVITACQPRVPVYMVFILLVPFIILIFAFQ